MLPLVGAVVRYGFVWSHQAVGVHSPMARKDRPCVIAALAGSEKRRRAFVCPITHTKPERGALSEAIVLSAATRRKLALDAEPQWIIAAEIDAFDWPGYELRLLADGSALYGILPDPVTEALRERVRTLHGDERLRTVPR